MKKLLALFPLMLILFACGKKVSDIKDFNKEIYTPEYASGFKILGTDDSGSVIIESNNPWQGADSVVTRLFIARDGESAPEGFKGQVLEGEAKRIVAMSSTHIAMLDAFAGERDTVCGVDDSVEDGIRHCGVADGVVPVQFGEL